MGLRAFLTPFSYLYETMLGLYEFNQFDLVEKAQYVIENGLYLSGYIENGKAYNLYKCPEFYSEIGFDKSNNTITEITGFLRGWRLDKHLDRIKIDTF